MNLIMSLVFEENKHSNADIIPHQFPLNQYVIQLTMSINCFQGIVNHDQYFTIVQFGTYIAFDQTIVFYGFTIICA